MNNDIESVSGITKEDCAEQEQIIIESSSRRAKNQNKNRYKKAILSVLLFVPRAIAKGFSALASRFSLTTKIMITIGSVYLVLASLMSFAVVFHTQSVIASSQSKILYEHLEEITDALSSTNAVDSLNQYEIVLNTLKINVVISEAAGEQEEHFWSNVSRNGIAYRNLKKVTATDKPRIKENFIVYKTQTSNQRYIIYIRKDLQGDYTLLFRTKLLMLIIVPTSFVFLMVCGGLFNRPIVRPLRKMNNKIKSITHDTLATTRLTVNKNNDEISQLARVFNNMLDNLQESFQIQERFVSDASHELKTPIAVLHGYSDMLSRWGKDDPEILQESIEAIKNETQHMKNLIEMLTFLSRPADKQAALKIKAFDLCELINEIIKEIKLTDSDHNIITGELKNVTIEADRQLIKQLIRILADNALKYTPKGGNIKFSCYQNEEHGCVMIEDTGIGISEEDLPYVFNRFYRADKARNRQSGSGLGLAIAKKIADAHKAEILISSTLGEGTQVLVNIPLFVEKIS